MDATAQIDRLDFFIAHAGADAKAAERLYELLSQHANVFLDSRSLKPGDLWDVVVPAAMSRAAVIIVLVSSRTEKAYYEREEIAGAVKAARAGSHRIVPVVLSPDVEPPYGLARVHAIVVSGDMTLEDVARRLIALDVAVPNRDPVAPARPFSTLTRGVSTWLFELEQFLEAYLGTVDAPVAFGGREHELNMLDEWFDGEFPFALVAAPAGRGKSALLTQWASRMAESGRAGVVFVPVSLRYGTARPSEAMSLLGERLMWLTSGREGNDPPTSPDAWRRRIARLLDRFDGEAGAPLLIVVDGIDESAGWHDEQLLPLPSSARTGIKVIVGARLRADREAAGWREWLRWRQATTRFIEVPPLGLADVATLVRSQLQDVRAGLPEQLYELSEGDPLVLSFYLADLIEGRGLSGHERFSALWQDVGVWWRIARA